ncbi:MAG: hypothetical protein IPK20_25680 [Betaproteobacteria bacterium]|nr:hypothetical protein [Betaproteobacteria bacterium]
MVRSSPLLAKLARPKLKQPVRRLRLFERLDCARSDSRSVFVAGPPGAGKTTLVASWLDARGVEGLWYRADPADRDPATFFHYLRDAVLGGSRRRVRTLPHLTPEYRSDVAGFARRFFRDMFRQLPEGSVFVLDNFQDAGGVAVMERVFAELLYEACGGSIVVVVSREEPPAPPSRARAEETLLRVDPAELRLTVDEAREVARGRFVGTDEALAALVRQADGWAAGLTLLLESAGRPGWAVGSYPAITRGEVFGYLATQVFEHMTEEERSFLLATARLPPFSVAMAEALTGNARSGEILSSLYRRHLFVHCTGDSERYFQYHGLFRGYLQHQGDAAMTAQRCGRCGKGRGGRVHEPRSRRAGDRPLHRGKAWPAAVPALEEVMHECLRQGRHDQIAAWIGRLLGPSPTGSPDPIRPRHRRGDRRCRRAPGLIAAAHRRFVDADDIVGSPLRMRHDRDHLPRKPPITGPCFPGSTNSPGYSKAGSAPPTPISYCGATPRCSSRASSPGLTTGSRTLRRRRWRCCQLLPRRGQRLLATTYLTIYATFAGRFDLTPALERRAISLVGQAEVTAYGRAHWHLWKAYMLRLADATPTLSIRRERPMRLRRRRVSGRSRSWLRTSPAARKPRGEGSRLRPRWKLVPKHRWTRQNRCR